VTGGEERERRGGDWREGRGSGMRDPQADRCQGPALAKDGPIKKHIISVQL